MEIVEVEEMEEMVVEGEGLKEHLQDLQEELEEKVMLEMELLKKMIPKHSEIMGNKDSSLIDKVESEEATIVVETFEL